MANIKMLTYKYIAQEELFAAGTMAHSRIQFANLTSQTHSPHYMFVSLFSQQHSSVAVVWKTIIFLFYSTGKFLRLKVLWVCSSSNCSKTAGENTDHFSYYKPAVVCCVVCVCAAENTRGAPTT